VETDYVLLNTEKCRVARVIRQLLTLFNYQVSGAASIDPQLKSGRSDKGGVYLHLENPTAVRDDALVPGSAVQLS
jgi:hypothetical protein